MFASVIQPQAMAEATTESKQSETTPVWEYKEFKTLSENATEITKLHLRNLLSAESNKECTKRNEALTVKLDEITLDCTRQQASTETLSKLVDLAKACNLKNKIDSMFNGDKVNRTENRSVLHIALRAKKTDKIWLIM